MLENNERATLIEAANALKSGMFVHIHGYVNKHGEKQNVTVHADANYDSVHARSLTKLNNVVADPDFKLEITWNFWQDAQGNRYERKAKGRTQVLGFKETVALDDPDMQEAIGKLRQSIVNPKEVETGFEQIAKSTYDNSNTGKTYFRNVLVCNKEIVDKGDYPVKCSQRVNVIRDAIEEMLPIGQYRCYVMETNELVTVTRGEGANKATTQVPRFEYVSIFHEKVESSSSSSAP